MFKPIKSSHLQEADYIDGKVQVRFQGNPAVYEYDGLSAEKYAEWEKDFQSDVSSGKFFAQHIKPLPYKKIK